MSKKCKYIVTRSGDQKFRCNREVIKGLFCPMHNEFVVEALERIKQAALADFNDPSHLLAVEDGYHTA